MLFVISAAGRYWTYKLVGLTQVSSAGSECFLGLCSILQQQADVAPYHDLKSHFTALDLLGVGQKFEAQDTCGGCLHPPSSTCGILLSPAVLSGLLRSVHGHPPHAPLRLGPRLRPGPVPLLPTPHLHAGPHSPHSGTAGPHGPLRALRGHTAQANPPRLGEEPPHPLHSAGGRLSQRAGRCQSSVK